MKYMKISQLFMIATMTLSSFGAATSAFANSPSTNIKADMIKSCTSAYTSKKVMSSSDAKKYCNCYVNAQSKMTLGDVWEIQSRVNAKRDPSSLAAVKRSNAELKSCAGNIKIKQS